MSDAQTSAVQRPGAAAVPDGWQPQIVALVCNWCTYAGADMAGTTRLEYPASVRMVRFPCTGRMSPLMILRAFEQGADGVLVSGCHPGDCHYVQGNLVARRRFTIFRSLLDFLGVDLKRLHFAWVSAAEGHKWARVVKDVTAAVTEAGPLPRLTPADAWDGPELPAMEGDGPEGLSAAETEALRTNLRSAASELLNNQRVGLVVGYRAGSLPGRMVPAMVSTAADCKQLDWGPGCVNNLVAYAKTALEKADKVALVVKTCDLGAVTGLIREGQISRDQVRLIGVQCQGVGSGDALADKCLSCSGAPHPVCDLVVTVDGVRESCADPSDAPAEIRGRARPPDRSPRVAARRRALAVLAAPVRSMPALLRVPGGVSALLLLLVHRRQAPPAVGADRDRRAWQQRLERDSCHPPRRPLFRLR